MGRLALLHLLQLALLVCQQRHFCLCGLWHRRETAHNQEWLCYPESSFVKNAGKKSSRRRRIILHLLQIALLDLLHHGFAAKQISFELHRNLARHDSELVLNHFRKRNRATRGDKMRTPLKHQSNIPEDKAG